MKKTITLAILMLFLVIGMATAGIIFPLPINGKIVSNYPENQEVKITNLRTGISETTLSSSSGEYLIEWANTQAPSDGSPKHISSDTFRIELTSCSSISNDCVSEVTYTSQPNIYTEFNTNALTPACPTCPACPSSSGGSCSCTYTEWKCNELYPPEACPSCPTCDGSGSGNCEVCKECPELELNGEVCEAFCPQIESCPEVPEKDENGNWLIYLLIALGGLGVGAFGGVQGTKDRISKVKNVTYRVVVPRDGGAIREEHRHPGIKSYHDINTLHREEHEKHKKGEKFPLYQKDSEGVYNYIG